MKKLFALSLAALMVMSLGVTAFAATWTMVDQVSSTGAGPGKVNQLGIAVVSLAEWDKDEDSALTALATNSIKPGTAVYFPLLDSTNALITASDAVKSVKISANNQVGGAYIEGYRVEYKRFSDGQYGYVLAVQTKEAPGQTGTTQYAAEVKLSKSSGTLAFEMKYRLGFGINFDSVATDIFRFPKVVNPAVTNVPDTEETFEFEDANGVYFEADMFQQPKGIAAFNVRYNPLLVEQYETDTTHLEFFNGNGMVFAKIGVLTIPAAEGSVLYVQDDEGNLALVENAEYNSAEEAFKVNTRVLGKYVVASAELNLTPAEVVVPDEQKPNVDTGAAA